MIEIRLANNQFDADGVKIWFYNREEYAEVLESHINDHINDYPELTNMKYIAYSENEENPYEVVVYDNGEVWVYGAQFDTSIHSFKDVLSNVIVALKMLVAGEYRELTADDVDKFDASIDNFLEVR